MEEDHQRSRFFYIPASSAKLFGREHKDRIDIERACSLHGAILTQPDLLHKGFHNS